MVGSSSSSGSLAGTPRRLHPTASSPCVLSDGGANTSASSQGNTCSDIVVSAADVQLGISNVEDKIYLKTRVAELETVCIRML